ncbi:response regulator transcription factor [Pelagirhabdus alkalitolerans]|nr:response regulator transcription factor [Pelagirhabdus alkalitolerans]
MENKLIMIVEDEAGIREMTHMFLSEVGYQVVAATSGEEALKKLETVNPHLILLDIQMEGMDGFSVCRQIRESLTVPIIFLTVRREITDKVKCFEYGGDDYVTKPFEFEELHARIKANIRRYYTYPKEERDILKYDDIEIHLHNYKCFLDGEFVELSTKEMALLVFLAKHPNRVWSQEQLYDQIWQEEAVGNIETIKVHINYLRRKIEKNPSKPKYIKTVRGFGYVFTGS